MGLHHLTTNQNQGKASLVLFFSTFVRFAVFAVGIALLLLLKGPDFKGTLVSIEVDDDLDDLDGLVVLLA